MPKTFHITNTITWPTVISLWAISCVTFRCYHPCLPSTMCWATSRGNLTPRIRNSVTALMASIQASNGDKQTYQPAQKNPIGQARNQRARNQMIAHKTFIVSAERTPSKTIHPLYCMACWNPHKISLILRINRPLIWKEDDNISAVCAYLFHIDRLQVSPDLENNQFAPSR